VVPVVKPERGSKTVGQQWSRSMETKERLRMSNFLRTLSDIGLRNKERQIMIRTSQQEASSSSNTEHNKEKELQIAEIENSLT